MAWYDQTTIVERFDASATTTKNQNDIVRSEFGGFTSAEGLTNPERTSMEVKLSHRFKVRYGLFEKVGHHVKTVTRPNVTFAEVEVPKLNSKVYFAGRKTQDQATVEMDDTLDNTTMRAVQTQMGKQVNFDNNSHASSGSAYFFNFVASTMRGTGKFLDSWYYHDGVLMTADFGTLDYSDDAGLCSISLGIRYANFTTEIHEGTDAKVDWTSSYK